MAGAALALPAPLSIAKDPKWVGPVNQPPLSLGQASVLVSRQMFSEPK